MRKGGTAVAAWAMIGVPCSKARGGALVTFGGGPTSELGESFHGNNYQPYRDNDMQVQRTLDVDTPKTFLTELRLQFFSTSTQDSLLISDYTHPPQPKKSARHRS